MTTESLETQIEVTKLYLDKETSGISIIWVTASFLPSYLTANRSSIHESKYLIRGFTNWYTNSCGMLLSGQAYNHMNIHAVCVLLHRHTETERNPYFSDDVCSLDSGIRKEDWREELGRGARWQLVFPSDTHQIFTLSSFKTKRNIKTRRRRKT